MEKPGLPSDNDVGLHADNFSQGNITGSSSTSVIAGDTVRTAVLAVTMGSLILATIFGNSLVVFAIFHVRALRCVTNYFIVSLAVSDLALGVLVIPLSSAYEILGHWVFGAWMCVLWCAVDVMCCTASILNLVAISVDRYLAINKPMLYPNLSTSRRALIAILLVWATAILISVPPVFGWRNERRDLTQCELTSGQGYVIYSALGSFYIPLAVMLVVYSRIYVTAVRQTKKIKRGSNLGSLRRSRYKPESDTEPISWKESTLLYVQRKASRNSSSSVSHDDSLRDAKKRARNQMGRRIRRFAKEKKAAKTLAIVVGAFVLCWCPFFSVYLIREVCKSCHIPSALFKFVFWLGYCNSFLNPIIYPCLNRDFRHAFRKIMCKPWCRDRSLDYYDVPIRSVKAIRASRRLRLSLVPHSSSSGSPPDSPNMSLLRQQSELRRLSRGQEAALLTEVKREGLQRAPVLCNVHVALADDVDSRRSSPVSRRPSSRVQGSFSVPSMDVALACCPDPPLGARLSQTSDCLQLLAGESSEKAPNKHPWCLGPERKAPSTEGESFELLHLPTGSATLIRNYHAREHDDEPSSRLAPAAAAQSLNNLMQSPPEHGRVAKLTAGEKLTGSSWPNFTKYLASFRKQISSGGSRCSIGGHSSGSLQYQPPSIVCTSPTNSSLASTYNMIDFEQTTHDMSTQTSNYFLHADTREMSVQTDNNSVDCMAELLRKNNRASWTL